ncbi:hypothetical protein FBZ98_10370 [Rhizobium sp. ERR 922]|nr:hypothetical protein FBZ98_10370 [Rhizobium sp. ERR 922]TWB97974.1 hypothetical protein FBZ97_103814 [Rhizobium sp. ERR 942]
MLFLTWLPRNDGIEPKKSPIIKENQKSDTARG